MKRGVWVMGLLVPILVLVVMRGPVVQARQARPADARAPFQSTSDSTIDICHANPSEATPYLLRTVTNDATIGGHLAHTATPFDPANLSWPDIIPAPQDEHGVSYCPASPPASPEEPQTGSITVHKVDQHGDPVPSACFNLGLAPLFMAAQSGANCTDESGTLVIDGLDVPGTYQLAEESVPDGCTIDGDLPTVRLSEEEPNQDVTVTNTCVTPPTTPTVTATATATEPPASTVPATAAATSTDSATTATTITTSNATAAPPQTRSTTPAPRATVSTLPTTGSGPAAGNGTAIWALIGVASMLLLAAWTAMRRQSR